METKNKTLERLEQLKELLPEVITETKDANGDIVSAIDAKKLEQLLSTKVIEGDESYDFTWVGKKQAMVEASRPIRKTLRPCKEESVDWENTENLYIEGDNLDVLKLLQESYLNKIKMIYIDPPYNTGNDSFIYPDDYKTNKDQYDEEIGAIDESGYRMFKNTKDKGRFHSSWCSMMYSRLKLARNLLTDDGVIFISIDDNEIDNMLKICTEIFGYEYVDKMVWRKSGVGRDGKMKNTTTFRKDHEYIVVCFKNCQLLNKSFEKPRWENEYGNPDNDPRGGYKAGSISKKEEASNPNHKNYYTVPPPSGKSYTRQFDVSLDEFIKLDNDNRIYWGAKLDAVPAIKIFQNEKREVTTSSYIIEDDSYLKECVIDDNNCTTTQGSKELEKILAIEELGSEMRPKPVELLVKLCQIGTNKDSTILDFFSGSATTAHAMMQLNAEDGGNRKFIMVQLPEVCDEKSVAYKAKYKNICEIGKERIRRAGKKIKEETGKTDLDIGFRVLKLDESNMKDVYYAPADYNQSMLDKMTSNIKEDRTPEDLLYACMLEWGLELSLPHETKAINGYNIHIVNEGDLIACFDDKVTEDVIKQIADMKPLRVVFRDSSFATDSARINVDEIFKLKSPNTKIKVL